MPWSRSGRLTAPSSLWTARWGIPPSLTSSRRSSRSGISRCSSPSSSSSLPQSGCRCAGGSRSGRRSQRFSRVRTTSSGWLRSHVPPSSCAARMPASRSVKTAPHRWRSRTSLRSARSTAPQSCTRPTPIRRRSSSPRWPTSKASLSSARHALQLRLSTTPRKRFRSAAARSCVRRMRTTSRSSAPASRCTKP